MEERVRKQLLTRIEQGKPTPEVENRPQLPAFLQPVLHEFFVLGAARPIGMGVGPIPPSAIEGHLDTVGIDGERREDWRRYWRALDNRYLEKQRERTKKTAPAVTPRPQGRQRHTVTPEV